MPVTKAAPVEYVRVCSAHGAGFFYVPGSDTCIKLGGRVRADYYYTQPRQSFNFGDVNAAANSGRYKDTIGWRARARLDVDTRTPTDFGTLRTFFRFQIDKRSGADGTGNGALLDKAFIQWAGITAGYATSFFDFYASDLNWGAIVTPGSDLTTNLLAYTATFGSGFSATLSLEDRNNRQVSPALYDVAGQRVPDVVANIRVDQDWGSAQLSGALHQLNSGTIYNPWGAQWSTRVDTTYGWAVQGGVKLKVPALGKGDVLWLQAAYADGALGYIGLTNTTTIGRSVNVAADGYIVNGDIKKTSGWNITAAGVHYWTPSIRSTLWGSYTGVDVNREAAISTYGNRNLRDFNVWQVGSALIWSPVSKFDIGVEVLYGRVERDSFSYYNVNTNQFVFDRGRNEDQIQTRLRLQRDF
ncbi:MAG: porin [Pseudochelatococcus sp.]